MERSKWAGLRWIAHRCGGEAAPENSLAGLRAAAAAGYRAVEFDVMLSSEGSPWLIHDDSLDRTSFSRGEVGRLPDRLLSGVDISRGCDARFRGEPLPRYGDALTLCGELGLLPNIEIKPYPGTDAATGERAANDAESFLHREGAALAARDLLLSSFSIPALAAAQRVAPALPRALLFEQVPADWQDLVARLEVVAIHCDCRQTDWRWIADAKAMGLAVRAYTVNDAGLADQLFQRGVDAVFTDAVGRLGP